MTAQDLMALPRLSGVVVHGDKRGRVLGFPTANILLDSATDLTDGVYSCWVQLPNDETLHGATLSLGRNPTFDDVHERRAEAYIHDLDTDLYGQRIVVLVARHLRGMVRFASVEQLIAQTAMDVVLSRQILADHPADAKKQT